MDSIIETLVTVMKGYARPGLNGISLFTQSEDLTAFTVVTIAKQGGRIVTFDDLIVRIAGDFIVIHRDENSVLLVNSLVNAGVPRERIILAYAGEPVPDELPELR